jgi:hypothetical protein
VDPFARGYVSFPAMDNESAGPIGLSNYCVQHYSQPGCQTNGIAANEAAPGRWDRGMRRSDAGDYRNDMSRGAGTVNRN